MAEIKTFLGDPVKLHKRSGNFVTVSGKGVLLDEPGGECDLTMEYFTKDTYFGVRKGDKSDALFHHGYPIVSAWDAVPPSVYKIAYKLSRLKFKNPVRTSIEKEGMAILAELILDMRDKYEAYVADLVGKGLLSWSSGAMPQMVDVDRDSGEIKCWPIIEFSLTPTPAEPRTAVSMAKSLSLPSETIEKLFGDPIESEKEPEPPVAVSGDMSIAWKLSKLRQARYFWEHSDL